MYTDPTLFHTLSHSNNKLRTNWGREDGEGPVKSDSQGRPLQPPHSLAQDSLGQNVGFSGEHVWTLVFPSGLLTRELVASGSWEGSF